MFSVTNLIIDIYKNLGFEKIILKYSDRPEKRVGDDKIWDKSEAALLTAIKEIKTRIFNKQRRGSVFTDRKLNLFYKMQ